MHLRNRRGSDRRAEAEEHRVDRAAERSGDHRFGFLLREGRHPILQMLEIAGERGADHVRTGGEKLSKLDVARAEPRQRGGKARIGGAARRPFEQTREAHQRTRRRRNERRIDRAENALAGEDEAGATKTQQLRGSGDHKRQPECSVTMPPLIGRNETRAKPAARIIAANGSGFGNRRIDSTR